MNNSNTRKHGGMYMTNQWIHYLHVMQMLWKANVQSAIQLNGQYSELHSCIDAWMVDDQPPKGYI